MAKSSEPVKFTKEQFLKSKTFGLPVDAVSAILKDGEEYTHKQARLLVENFLKRKV